MFRFFDQQKFELQVFTFSQIQPEFIQFFPIFELNYVHGDMKKSL